MTGEEQSALRDLIADITAEVDPTLDTAGALTPIWSRIVDLDLDAVDVGEDFGGAGGTLADLAVVVDALGEAGVGVPIIESATARWVLARSGTRLAAKLPVVVTNTTIEPSRVITEVPWGRSADLIVVYHRSRAAAAYNFYPSESVILSTGVNVAGEQRDVVDLSSADRIELPNAPEASVVDARLGLLWAAALTGAVRGAYRRTRDHVRSREQFGAPLIRIPAVASALATFRTQLLLAETAVTRALDATCSDGADPDLEAAAVARVVAAASATEAARLAHQLHGAIGITREGGLYRLTTKLWAWQDAITSQRIWARHLGEVALVRGEDDMWSQMTAV